MGAGQIAILLLGIIPLDIPTTDKVDLVEHNHFYDENGREVFQQLIWWDWDKYNSRFVIRDWRLVTDKQILPIDGRSVFYDGGTMREIKATSKSTSWLQYDPELADREMLPKEQRRELSKPARRTAKELLEQ